MTKDQNNKTGLAPGEGQPWYRQFWPWFIIALPASVVIASFFTLWLAISNPDHLVVDEDEYRQLKSELKAQKPVDQDQQAEADKSEP
jgi:hypothetical protein